MKISVIMVDGGFREKVYGAECFDRQDFPDDEYEVLWVEYFDKIHSDVIRIPRIKTLALNKPHSYHSSVCFNHGIMNAKGEVLVIPDPDQIVLPDFLSKMWKKHQDYERLVVYGYRYDQITKEPIVPGNGYHILEKDFQLNNPVNYGGCLTIRKKWLLELNGYEQHESFGTGAHANGLDLYTRFKNYGLAVCWDPNLKLYHPWHEGTLILSPWHKLQLKIVDWRHRTLNYMALNGIDSSRNCNIPPQLNADVEAEIKRMREMQPDDFPHIM